jgi:hypothetical protein
VFDERSGGARRPQVYASRLERCVEARALSREARSF